jgi:methylase of polypeptide subunit release factors
MDLDVAARLGDDLRAAGYDTAGVLGALGDSAHRALARGEKVPARRATADGSPLSTLIRVFLLGGAVQRTAMERVLATTGVDAAVAQGVLESDGDTVRPGLDLRPYGDDDHEYLVLSDLDSDVRPGPVRPDHVLGIGAASLSLVRATVRERVGSVLDLGTGCGVQALHCFHHTDRLTATDTSQRALGLAAATARMNSQAWDLRRGSLFEPVGEERFDLIVSNPPFVISAGEQRFSYRDSGVAGDGLVRSLVEQVPAHLNPGGTAQLLANWMVHDDSGSAGWHSRVGSWVSGTGLDAWVVQRELADPAEYVALWLKDAGESGDSDDTAEAWLDWFDRERVTGIGMGLITLRRPIDSRVVPDVVLDEITAVGEEITGEEAAAFLARRDWLRGVDDAALLATRFALSPASLLEQRSPPGPEGWTTVYRMLRRVGGPAATLQLDEWTQGLLAGCRGELPLSVLVDVFAAGHGFDPTALTEAVIPAVRHAVTRGVLHPVA